MLVRRCDTDSLNQCAANLLVSTVGRGFRDARQCPILLPTPQCEQLDLATAREAQRIALPPHPDAGLDPATVLNVYDYTVWLG